MAWEILTKFIERASEAGVSRERIGQALEDAGWRPAQVRSAMQAYADAGLPVAVPRPAISATARELFLYLMLFSSLHVTVLSLGTILYQLINIALPDTADFYGGGYFAMVGNVESKLRSGLSGLAIFLPAYLWLDRKIEGLKKSDPGQGGSGVRRKLTFLTLYLTLLVLMFDATSFVSYWLNGELDLRVLLKCLVVAGLAALVLGRYLYEMSADEHPDTANSRKVRLIALALLLLVSLAAIIGAVRNIESPGAERKRKADLTRETALSQIDNAIVTYYRAYQKLPESLDEVSRFQHHRFPRDPESGKPYGYKRVDEKNYELCTTFRRARTMENLIAEGGAYAFDYGSSPFAEHPAGEHCFALEVKETPQIGGM